MLSRAKSLLIILGNPLTLRRSSDFKYILNECTEQGTFLKKKKVDKSTKLANSHSLLDLKSIDSGTTELSVLANIEHEFDLVHYLEHLKNNSMNLGVTNQKRDQWSKLPEAIKKLSLMEAPKSK